MKQPLNHKNPLDQKLQERLHNAEAMPPSFQKLFGHLPVNSTRRHSLRKWLRSSLFLLSISASLFFTPILNSDNRLTNTDEPTVLITNLPQVDLDLNKKNLNIKVDRKALANSINNKFSESKRLNVAKLSIEERPTIKFNTNADLDIMSGSKLLFVKKSIAKPISIQAEVELIDAEPSEVSELHSAKFILKKASVFQPIEKVETSVFLPSLTQINNPKKKKGSWFVGLTGAVNNTWILNQNTYDEFSGYEFAYKLDWGYQYGVRLGYHPTKKGWGFELGYVPVSEKGQKYEDIIQAQKQHREVNLNYAQTIFKLKFRQPFSKKANGVAINWEIGGAYNQLHNAYQNNNGIWSEITDRFRDNSWQVSLGTSLDIPVSQSVFFTLGLQGAMSTDINSKGWRAPGSYGKSHTIILGLQTGVSYQFR